MENFLHSLKVNLEKLDFYRIMFHFSERLKEDTSLPHNTRELMVRLFKPLKPKKNLIVTLGASIILSCLLYWFVNIGFAEVVRQNSYDISMLEANLLANSNLNLSKIVAKDEEIEMLKFYTERLEQRKFASVIRLLYPMYSPEKVLAPAMKALENAQTKEDIRKAIQQAGLACEQLYALGERFPRSPKKWFVSEDVTPWLDKLDSALADSRRMVGNLANVPTSDNAKAAFAANMKTMLLLFPAARLGSGSDSEVIRTKIKDFQDIVKLSQRYAKNVANRETNIETKVQILLWARNEQRQADILNATSGNKMDEVGKLLRERVGTSTIGMAASDKAAIENTVIAKAEAEKAKIMKEVKEGVKPPPPPVPPGNSTNPEELTK